jgi:3-oxoacyl-[acyl-carrier-protein] synthase II
LSEGVRGASPRLFAYTLPSSPVGEICIHHHIRGPAITLANGVTAGLAALDHALMLLRSGRADRALVLAVDVATPLLERLLGQPLRDSAAALLLERGADAAARGARLRGRVLGSAAAFADVPAQAAAAAAERALADAAVAASDLRRLYASDGDAAALAPLGIAAPSVAPAGELLAAGALAAAVELFSAPCASALVVASDGAGAAAAAVLAC